MPESADDLRNTIRELIARVDPKDMPRLRVKMAEAVGLSEATTQKWLGDPSLIQDQFLLDFLNGLKVVKNELKIT